MKETGRGKFGSRIGFLLVSAGCTIGIGNVWRFPFIAGVNAEAVFVMFYLLFLVLMGVPVMTMELIRYGIKNGEFREVDIDEIVNMILYSYQGVRMWSRIIPIKPKTGHSILKNIKRQLTGEKI